MHSPVAWVALFDSNVETIPREIIGERSLTKLARKNGRGPERTILDRSSHHFAMQRLRDGQMRGRPDIVHMSVLSITDTPVYASGRVDLIVHTVGDRLIMPAKEWRPPRNYRNFLGLMEDLLQAGRVPPEGRPILKMVRGDIKDAVSRTGAERAILLSSHGKLCDLRERVQDLKDIVVVYLIGGYAKGKPRAEVVDVADDVVSIHPSSLSSSVVTARLMYEIERATALQ